MRVIDVFFKVYGVKQLFKIGQEGTRQIRMTDIIVELNELGSDIKPPSKKRKCCNIFCKVLLFIISLLYSLFVLLIIVWPFAFAIALSAIHGQLEYVFVQIFTLVYVAQFVTGFIYYNSKSYKDMIRRNHRHKNKIIALLCIGFVVALTLAALMTILIALNLKMDIYNTLVKKMDTVQKVFFYILLFLTLFYSYNIFISNLIIFSVVLIIHCLELRAFENSFNSFIEDYRNEITLMSIIDGYNHLKNINNKSINDLNNMFSSMTIIGGVGVYFLILLYAFHTYSVSYYVDIIIYTVVEIIYFYTIYSLKNHMQNIVSLGTSPKFMNRYLTKRKFYNFKGDEIEAMAVAEEVTLGVLSSGVKTIQDILLRVMIRSSEGNNSLDWLILNAIFTEEWEHFQLFGFDINDTTLVKKILWIIIGYIFLSQFETYWGSSWGVQF
jgi:hypothetical protein